MSWCDSKSQTSHMMVGAISHNTHLLDRVRRQLVPMLLQPPDGFAADSSGQQHRSCRRLADASHLWLACALGLHWLLC